jgi:hypothetical protein
MTAVGYQGAVEVPYFADLNAQRKYFCVHGQEGFSNSGSDACSKGKANWYNTDLGLVNFEPGQVRRVVELK